MLAAPARRGRSSSVSSAAIRMKPSAAWCGKVSPVPYDASFSAYSIVSERRPVTTAALARSSRRTSPVTSSCVLSTKASIASRAGLNQRPSYTSSVQRCSSGRLIRASSFVSTTSSSAECAAISAIAAGTSYTSRLLMPTARFSIMSSRPIPYAPARPLSLVISAGERQLLAVERHGDAAPRSRRTTSTGAGRSPGRR